jgi:hypothetical protein
VNKSTPYQAVMIVVQVRCAHMTEAVIRRADDADLAAIAQLRREWTQEQEGDRGDPGFDERLAAWFARERPRRITWLAEADGRPVGMMNLAICDFGEEVPASPRFFESTKLRQVAARPGVRSSMLYATAWRLLEAVPSSWTIGSEVGGPAL